ncbi:hypothetical protein C8J56DRAFT_896485 [Mycena floridula]|nr:hypothetical protein C8J56DRAFT_896485 [Mycena floridula]
MRHHCVRRPAPVRVLLLDDQLSGFGQLTSLYRAARDDSEEGERRRKILMSPSMNYSGPTIAGTDGRISRPFLKMGLGQPTKPNTCEMIAAFIARAPTLKLLACFFLMREQVAGQQTSEMSTDQVAQCGVTEDYNILTIYLTSLWAIAFKHHWTKGQSRSARVDLVLVDMSWGLRNKHRSLLVQVPVNTGEEIPNVQTVKPLGGFRSVQIIQVRCQAPERLIRTGHTAEIYNWKFIAQQLGLVVKDRLVDSNPDDDTRSPYNFTADFQDWTLQFRIEMMIKHNYMDNPYSLSHQVGRHMRHHCVRRPAPRALQVAAARCSATLRLPLIDPLLWDVSSFYRPERLGCITPFTLRLRVRGRGRTSALSPAFGTRGRAIGGTWRWAGAGLANQEAGRMRGLLSKPHLPGQPTQLNSYKITAAFIARAPRLELLSGFLHHILHKVSPNTLIKTVCHHKKWTRKPGKEFLLKIWEENTLYHKTGCVSNPQTVAAHLWNAIWGTGSWYIRDRVGCPLFGAMVQWSRAPPAWHFLYGMTSNICAGIGLTQNI